MNEEVHTGMRSHTPLAKAKADNLVNLRPRDGFSEALFAWRTGCGEIMCSSPAAWIRLPNNTL